MKKYLVLVLVATLFCSFTFRDNSADFNFVGKWKSEDKTEKNSGFIFEADGYAFMFKDAEKMGGKEFDINGTKGSMKYAVDKNANPIKLDLIITIKKQKVETKKMLMLVKIIDNNTLSIAGGDLENVRPTKFTKENTVTFKRVK
ncbi:hypothetical protein [Flavobacterium sp.]|uniref:hypothetical protein n=1 Tax=Flavobacterium sp. TaxID=239 RepID=UPI00375251B8